MDSRLATRVTRTRHVRRRQHGDQNDTLGRKDRHEALVSKVGTDFDGQVGKQRRAAQVGAAGQAKGHGQSGIDHTQDSQKRKGGEGFQVLEPTEGQQDKGRDGPQDSGAITNGHETIEGIGQDHGKGQTGDKGFGGGTPGGQKGRPGPNRLGPGFGIGTRTRVVTDLANPGKPHTRQRTHEGNQKYGGEDRHAIVA